MRNGARLAAVLAGLALVAIPVNACTREEEAEPSASGTPASPASLSAEERAATEALLKAAALRAEDLPEGFTLDEYEGEKFITNEESAEDGQDSPGTLALEDLTRWGRILGYEAQFSQEESPNPPSSDILLFDVTVDLFRDLSGAHEFLEFGRQYISNPENFTIFEEGSESSPLETRDVSVSPISIQELGDERLAFEFRGTTVVPNLPSEMQVAVRLIAIRRGRAVGAITVVGAGSSPSLSAQELEDLARKLDERMKGALE